MFRHSLQIGVIDILKPRLNKINQVGNNNGAEVINGKPDSHSCEEPPRKLPGLSKGFPQVFMEADHYSNEIDHAVDEIHIQQITRICDAPAHD